MDHKETTTWIDRAKKGDHKAFTFLVDSYKDMVYMLSLKMSKSTEDAEEIAQDAFIKAFRGINRFKGKSKFSTWLYQITYFTAINHLRKRKFETFELSAEDHAVKPETIFSALQHADRKKCIDEALNYLTPEERALITLYYLEENTIEEIAGITLLSVANVKVKIHRTRKKLYAIMHGLFKNELNSLV